MLRQKDKLFQQSVTPDGAPWKKLADATASAKESKNRKDLDDVQARRKAEGKAKLADHKILIDTSALKNSLTQDGAPYQVTTQKPNEVKIGTNLPYAAIQNFGGTITKKTLHGSVKIVIPARRFMGFGKGDNQQINEKIAAFIKKQGA
jgi:phage gpG-like protein